MNNIDEKLKNIFFKEQLPPSSYNYMINNTINHIKSIQHNKHKLKNLKFTLATSCCSILLITGVVFAKDIERILNQKFFSMGKGISTAVDNGYIAESKMDLVEKDMVLTNAQTGEFLDTIHTKSKIESAVIADGQIGVELYFEFDSKLNEYVNLGKNLINGNIDYENSHYFEFSNLFILDDENKIICVAPDGEKKCRDYFLKNNLNYDNTINRNGLSSIIGTIDNNNPDIIKLTVELAFGKDELLHSKKLFVCFDEFNLVPKITQENEIEAKMKSTDDWFMEIDIPEKFYNTDEEFYKVKKCENENFDIYVAKVSNTGFELGLTIKNEIPPVYPTKLDDIANNLPPYNGEMTKESYIQYYGEEYVTLLENYYTNLYLIRTYGYIPWVPWIEKTDGCYIQNSNGEKFYYEISKKEFTEPENKNIYWYNANFSMTKFDATDEITAVIDFKGQPVRIELEKIK